MRYATFYAQEKKIARVILAQSYFLRLRGLIGRELAEDEGLILSPCNQIHTFFMDYPIDALYLDKDYRILRIDPEIPPCRALKREKKARHILELPANTASDLELKIGELLTYVKE